MTKDWFNAFVAIFVGAIPGVLGSLGFITVYTNWFLWVLGFAIAWLIFFILLWIKEKHPAIKVYSDETQVIKQYKKLITRLKFGDEIIIVGRAGTSVVSLVPEICKALHAGASVTVFILDPSRAQEEAKYFNQLEPLLVRDVIENIIRKTAKPDNFDRLIGPESLEKVNDLLNACIEEKNENFSKLGNLIQSMIEFWKAIKVQCKLNPQQLRVFGVKDDSLLSKVTKITYDNGKKKEYHYFVGVHTHKAVGIKNPIIGFGITGDNIQGLALQINNEIAFLLTNNNVKII